MMTSTSDSAVGLRNPFKELEFIISRRQQLLYYVGMIAKNDLLRWPVTRNMSQPCAPGLGRNFTADLDPEIWCEIMKRVPDIDRLRHVPMVSRRFNEVCQDPALWPELRVQCADFQTEIRWQSFLCWLARRAYGLQMLVFNDTENEDAEGEDGFAWERRFQDLTALLAASAPQLRSLDLWYPSYAPQNNALDLSSDIRQLSQLTSLTWGQLHTPVSTAKLVATLQGLPLLEHLSLAAAFSDLGNFMISIATSCPRLTSLHIGQCEGFTPAPWNITEIGFLTNLVELNLHHLMLGSLPDTISRLTALQRLSIVDDDRISINLPLGMTACRQLSRLHMMSDVHCPVLASLTTLRQLEVYVSTHHLPHEMSWPSLTGLTELELRLQAFVLNDIPSGLADMTRLRKLTVSHAMTLDLPEGPYLNGLESLCLYSCCFLYGLPGRLAAATELRHLDITLTAEIGLEAFFKILRSLRALETLRMSHLEGVQHRSWNSALKQFNRECVARGRRPPVITHT